MARRTRRLGLGILGALALLAAVAFFLTRDFGAPISKLRSQKKAPAPAAIVDENPLTAAHELRSLALTQEEDQLALEAIKQADHQVDLAYAMALRRARLQPPVDTPETRAINQKIAELEAQLATESAEIERITHKLQTATRSENEDIQDQLKLTQAQKALHEEELDDAHQELIDAGGDNESAIQEKYKEHQTVQHATATAGTESKPASFAAPASLVQQVRSLQSLWNARKRLSQAQQDANAAEQDLKARQQRLSVRLKDERRTIAPAGTSTALALPANKDQRGAALATLRAHVDWRKVLGDFDKRISDVQQLSKLYSQWAEIVSNQIMATLHALIRSVLWILLIAIVVIVTEIVVGRRILKGGFDRRQMTSMRMALRVSLRAIGALLALLVIFGVPTQLSTVLAFFGAGLTVALKDFIVAFFGWFVLMGKNGLSIGDWVEINGVGGEVIEIGLLRTVLMETGNWNDSGHPTGRKVAFVNSFAMENHYFNFTTKGQWLWDELNVLVLPDRDPYPLMAEIQQIVANETRENATAAEQEWQRATHSYGVQSFSAAPAINMRPTEHGINVVVRYVAQAHQRYELRTRIYKEIVELMRRPKALEAGNSIG